MSNSYIQVPPDGSGKKVYSEQHVISGSTVQAQIIHIADHLNPTYLQHVNVKGAASVTYAEGEPSMDAFGNLRVGHANAIATYDHTTDAMDDLYTTVLTNGGTSVHDTNMSSIVVAVTNGSGSKVTRTTDRYHYYQPGVGVLVIQTMGMGDSGKNGNIRKWGLYDDNDGLYWELSGSTLCVEIRSSTSGVVDSSNVPRSSWNGDKLDGTGISGMVLDLTKENFYWIDFAWLGVGVVRFGVLAPDGSRAVCHTFQNPNANTGPYMRTATLPIRYENYNKSGTAGITQMRAVCAAIYAESQTDYTYWRFSDIESLNKTVTTNTPILSVRSTGSFNGIVNRVTVYPDTLSVYVSGSDVKLDIYDGVTTFTGETFTAGYSTLESDVSASAIGDGYKFVTQYIPQGSHNIDLKSYFELNDAGIATSAGTSQGSALSFLGTSLNGIPSKVTMTLTYRELR